VEVGLEDIWSLAAADDAVVVVASSAPESSKQRAKKSFFLGGGLCRRRGVRGVDGMGNGVGVSPSQPTSGFVGVA